MVNLLSHPGRCETPEADVVAMHAAGLNYTLANDITAMGLNFGDLLGLFTKYGPALFVMLTDLAKVRSVADLFPLVTKHGATLWALINDIAEIIKE